MLPNVVDSDLSQDLKEMRRELDDLKPRKRMVKFQDLALINLREMHARLIKNIQSMNYALVIDVHVLLEHVDYQINPSKATLDFLQAIHKLEISTTNYVVTIQAFEGALPKFFCKSKEHKLVKAEDSMFDKIKSFGIGMIPIMVVEQG